MVRLTTIWNSKYVRFKQYNLYRSLVLSILTYGCESWTISALSTTKIQDFEKKSHRKLIGIKYKEMKTNEYIKDTMISLIVYVNHYYSLSLDEIKILRHDVLCIHIIYDNLSKTILQGMVGAITNVVYQTVYRPKIK